MVRQKNAKKDVAVTKAELRKELIDRMYGHCRYCGFFFLRRFDGDQVCDSPTCEKIDKVDINEII